MISYTLDPISGLVLGMLLTTSQVQLIVWEWVEVVNVEVIDV